MGGESAGVDFALIGHPGSWVQVRRLMDALRSPQRPPLEDSDLRDIFGWIPPRTVERLTIGSPRRGRRARGVYVETFIAPDRLVPSALRINLAKVDAAIACAAREGARVASLGGFTSILMERGRTERRGDASNGMALTTGNSLTAGFIVRGVERAAGHVGLDIAESSVLIVGSTGDLGTACARYFAPRARRLALCARREGPLRVQAASIGRLGREVRASSDPGELLATADVVIAVASMSAPVLDLRRCQPGALVCDAGYPKNLALGSRRDDVHVFWGGMGQVRDGWRNDSPVGDSFYRFPAPGVAHGCMLEGMVLGLEERFEPFSSGRGNITEASMIEILGIAESHGIVPAPLFDAGGLWPGERLVA
jgi:fatty aldehyde-generating acyl-ACP reductase